MTRINDLGTRNRQDGIQRVALLGHGPLVGKRAPGLAFKVHGINILADSVDTRVLLLEFTTLKTSLDVFTKGLNHPHVIYPSVVLLLPLAGGITDIG